ncbi:MAG: RuvX/YqgF family protein, partial [Thermoguttaceae bacterium]|nr:RuvX/YqgF family protein [Thermoguttaceae bacterium]
MAVPSRPPEKGKIAGIDFGTVRIGVAICDAERIMAFPYEIYRRRNEKLDLQY